MKNKLELDRETVKQVVKYFIWFEHIEGNPFRDFVNGVGPEEATDRIIRLMNKDSKKWINIK